MIRKKLIYNSAILLFNSFLILLFGGNIFYFTPTASASEKNSKHNYFENEVVAKIKPGEDISQLSEKYNLIPDLIKTSSKSDLYSLKSNIGASTEKIISVLKKNSKVISVQPNYKYKPLVIPNDKLFLDQWYFKDTTTERGGTSAELYWNSEQKNQTKVAIAIIDSGINQKQPELSGRITKGRAKGMNFSNPKRKPDDFDGHGTFISALIAAKTGNKKGMAGASLIGNLKIMPLKFDFSTTDAISAINYAKARSIPIINASWGGYGEEGLDPLLQEAIAAYPGVFVTAAGNGECQSSVSGEGCNHDSGTNGDRMYPCDFNLSNIICVGASDRNGNLTEYSDYGLTSVDVIAPGGTDENPILSLDLKKNRYTTAEGSSLSTAFVSAEAGLIISKRPDLSATQIIEIIKNSVDLEPSLAGKILTGGKVNFQKALDLAITY